MADSQLILHVKGTEQTTTLPRQIVRAGIAKGQISRSQLIWSPKENTWKQVRELPELWPSQKLAPAPVARVPQGGTPQAVSPQAMTLRATQPRAVQPLSTGPKINVTATRRVQAAGAAPAAAASDQPVKASATSYLEEPSDHTFTVVKWVCIVVGSIVLLLMAANYFMIDEPLNVRMARTAYAKVGVWGHLGAFVQPGFIIIHVPTGKVTAEEMPTFLLALAQSTPNNLRGEPFDQVCLTTGLTAHYSFSGYAWRDLGDMGGKSPDEIRTFLLKELQDGSGNLLAAPDPSLGDEAQAAQRARVWNALTDYFR